METHTYNELERSKSVQAFLAVNRNLEKDMQDIVELASAICNVPIALVTLVDTETQWIKAKVGVDIEQMPTETSFCVHAIKQDEVMVIDNATKDKRFKNLPVVSGAPNIRFYASASLKTIDGHNVGTLCVYDIEPRSINEMQRNCLTTLANQVSRLMELDQSLKLVKDKVDETNLQNETLKKIAQIQSHEYRGPLTSIMGLMNLIKENKYIASKEYLVLMDNAVHQLDNHISKVVYQANSL